MHNRNTIAKRLPVQEVDPRSGLHILANHPAYKVVRMPSYFVCKHGTKFCIPFETRRHGILWHFYTVGTVIGYAVERGDDPMAAREQSISRAENLHWANQNATVISNMKKDQETVFAVDYDDEITVEGIRFKIAKRPNDNVALVPVS